MKREQHTRTMLRLAVLFAISMAACGRSGGVDQSAVTISDSAGVRVVTHAAGPFLDTVPLEPLLSIGREGVPDYEFFRVVQVSPLASGNVVVANGGTSELMFYKADGSFLRRVGGRGNGPSELGFLSTVHTRAGDTLAVVDTRRRRIVYFDSAGVFVRGESFAEDLTTASPTSLCVFPGLMGLLADGTRFTRGWGCMEMRGADGVRQTIMTLELVRGERRDTLGRFSMTPMWEHGSAEPGPDKFDLIPFAPIMSWEVGAEHVYLSDGRELAIRVYDATGTVVRVLREIGTPPSVTDEDRELYLEERVRQERPHPDGVPFPERFAAYSRFLLSHEGELWARWAERPSEETARWTVYSQNGERVRRVVLPKIAVHAVRDGKIYGLVENELGIQTVVVLAG